MFVNFFLFPIGKRINYNCDVHSDFCLVVVTRPKRLADFYYGHFFSHMCWKSGDCFLVNLSLEVVSELVTGNQQFCCRKCEENIIM